MNEHSYEKSRPPLNTDILAGKLQNFADGLETIDDVKKEILRLKDNGVSAATIRDCLSSVAKFWRSFTPEMKDEVEQYMDETRKPMGEEASQNSEDKIENISIARDEEIEGKWFIYLEDIPTSRLPDMGDFEDRTRIIIREIEEIFDITLIDQSSKGNDSPGYSYGGGILFHHLPEKVADYIRSRVS